MRDDAVLGRALPLDRGLGPGEAGTARTENLIATWRRLVAMDYIESERVDKAVTEPGRRLHQE